MGFDEGELRVFLGVQLYVWKRFREGLKVWFERENAGLKSGSCVADLADLGWAPRRSRGASRPLESVRREPFCLKGALRRSKGGPRPLRPF